MCFKLQKQVFHFGLLLFIVRSLCAVVADPRNEHVRDHKRTLKSGKKRSRSSKGNRNRSPSYSRNPHHSRIYSHSHWHSHADAVDSEKLHRVAVNVRGDSIGERITFPGTQLQIICFELQVFRLECQRNIGTANLCITLNTNGRGGKISFLSETTTFESEQGSFTTITAPFVEQVLTTTTGQEDTTFVLSTISGDNINNIVRGDGNFDGVSGSVRISGYFKGNFTSAELFFDQIYVIEFRNEQDFVRRK